ncbi:MAG: hypothetical protein AMJ55_09130 [Gammaproteobacteria bacterium SG8_15]|nr:MAG: hypothetical protein AMJ55_09130 [Gammaproteobacteria bacterium SG8_15]
MKLILIFSWSIFGLFFLMLTISAYSHASEKEKLTAISPYWCFYESIYDEQGKQLCKKGKFMYLLAIPLSLLTMYFF